MEAAPMDSVDDDSDIERIIFTGESAEDSTIDNKDDVLDVGVGRNFGRSVITINGREQVQNGNGGQHVGVFDDNTVMEDDQGVFDDNTLMEDDQGIAFDERAEMEEEFR